jgi:CDP-paratose 2-epimerase
MSVRPRLKVLGAGVRTRRKQRHVLVTGGAGFVGCNLADALCSAGEHVLLLDNLSRAGVDQNVAWLREQHPGLVDLEVGDVRDARLLNEAVQNASAVFHLAAQVAVTTSLASPVHDFEVNARGTLNLLEAIRAQPDPPPLIFTSTNKVYGHLDHVRLRLNGKRYQPVDRNIRRCGVAEDERLDFYSPYGCSKGAADQYVLDYARTFDIPAVVFRMSCIYGPHQFGTEDQGWVAHFLIQALNGDAITIYGDGKQVRDVLFVGDLVRAFELARANINQLRGEAFNVGGGPENTTSLIELLESIHEITGTEPDVEWSKWRPGDQRYYVSNFAKLHAATGWQPTVGVREGVEKLREWLSASRAEATEVVAAVPA